MHRYITRIGLAIVVVLACSSATVAVAATDSWKDDSASWSDPSNWNPFGVPGAGDTVNIVDFDGVSRTITYDYTGSPVTLGTLTIDLANGASSATNTLSMAANNLTAGQELVGTNGNGSVNQSGGTNTMNSSDALVVGGINGGSVGTYTLSGGAVVANGNEFVGDANGSYGYFNHSGGTNTIANGSYLILGGTSGAYGFYNLSNTGTLTANYPEAIGDFGTGTFNQTGGINSIDSSDHTQGNLILGDAAGSTGNYQLSSGTLTVNNIEEVGLNGNGSFIQNGGTNTIGGQNISFGGLDISSGSGSGTYTLNDGALTAGQEQFGGGSHSATAAFVQMGGTNHINAFGLIIVGSTGPVPDSYTLNGGSLLVDGTTTITLPFTSPVEFIGEGNAAAVFTQTGGTNTINGGSVGDLELGAAAGSSGTYNLSGGTASISGNVYLGSGVGGTGTLNVSGTGILNVGGTLTVFNNATGSSVNLNGGTINTPALNFNSNPALLNWTGGTLNLTTDVTFDSAADPTSTSAAFGSALTLGTNQTLMVTGNETLGGVGPFALTLNPGSVHTVTSGLFLEDNGTLNLNGGTLNNTAFYQYGGTVNGTLVVPTNGTYVYIAGTFNGQLVNQGFVEFDETGFIAGNGMNNSGTLYPLGNETVTFNGAGLINSSPIQGFSTNIIAASLTNSGKLSLIDCTLQATGASSNSATGVIDMIGGTLACGTGPSNQLVNDGRINLIDVTVNGDIYSPADGVINTAGSTTFNGNVTAEGQTLVGALQNAGAFYQAAGTLIGSGNFTNSGTVIIAGSQSWSPGTTFTNTAGSATFQSDAGSAGNSPLTVLVNGGVVTFTVPEHLAALSVASPSGTLGIDIASPTSFGKAIVNGLLTAGGTLQVSLTNNFTPVKGDSFDILDWGNLSGIFNAVDLPTMNGRIVWDSSQLYTTGVLTVSATYLAGDFNRDGHVDAADVLAMEFALVDLNDYQNGGDSLHESLTNAEMLAIGDINGDGVVNNADLQYLINTLKSGGGSTDSVPEPASWVLASLVLAAVSVRRRGHARCRGFSQV